MVALSPTIGMLYATYSLKRKNDSKLPDLGKHGSQLARQFGPIATKTAMTDSRMSTAGCPGTKHRRRSQVVVLHPVREDLATPTGAVTQSRSVKRLPSKPFQIRIVSGRTILSRCATLLETLFHPCTQ